MKDARWRVRPMRKERRGDHTLYEIFYPYPDEGAEPVIARSIVGHTLAQVLVDTHNRDLETHGSA